MDIMKEITIKQALELGYEYFFVESSTMEICHNIRDEAADYLKDGEVLIAAEKSYHMILDAESIFDNACEQLHEGAFDNVFQSEEYKLFEKVCEYVSQALQSDTQSYRETNIKIVANKL